MRRLQTTLVALLLALVSACAPSLGVEPGSAISCATNHDCPAKMRCLADAQRCVPIESGDESAPTLVEAAVTPGQARAGTLVSISLQADRALIAVPVVKLQAAGFSRTVDFTQASSDGVSFESSYTVRGDEPETTTTVVATLVDELGIVTPDAVVGTVTLDFTPPHIVDVTLSPTVTLGSTTWTEDTSLTGTVNASDDGTGVGVVEIDGDLTNPGPRLAAADLTIELTDTDGPKALTVVAVDSVGNRSDPTAVFLWLERTLPSDPLAISLPAAPTGDVWLNADSLAIYFSNTGSRAADFRTYVSSTDGGLTWNEIGAQGPAIIAPLAQDATTSVEIAEQDVFGNVTVDAARARLVVHEDSQPPPPPIPNETTIVGPLSASVGIALEPQADDSGQAVTYELQGGGADFLPVGPDPFIDLTGLAPGGTATYLIRTRDRAGNTSTTVPVTVFDSRVARTALTSCVGYGCFKRSGHRSGGGAGVFIEHDLRSTTHTIKYCRQGATAGMSCGTLATATSATENFYGSVDTNGRTVVFQSGPGGASSISAVDVGDDGLPGTGDDLLLEFFASMCPAVSTNGFVYIRWLDQTLRFYGFGPDGLAGTADDLGVSTVSAAGALPAIGSTCRTAFDGRHMTWLDDRNSPGGDVYLYDFGADGIPGTADDIGQAHVNAKVTSLVLGSQRLYVRYGAGLRRLVDFGPDDAFGTSDDQELATPLSPATDIYGDKLFIEDSVFGSFLFDVSSQRILHFDNRATGRGVATHGSIGPNLTFFAVADANGGDLDVGYLQALVAVKGYRSDPPALHPSGALSDDLVYYPRMAEHSLTSLRHGGDVSLAYGEMLGGTHVDIDGRLVAFLDGSEVALYDVGADMVPGTSDDRGPTDLTSDGLAHAWPRVSGRIVVFTVGSGLFVGPTSFIRAIDLGADGWVGGGDDVAYDVTSASGWAYGPDISGDRIAWLDLRNDSDKACPTLDTCNLDVYSTILGSGVEEPIETDPAAQAAVRIEGDTILWTDHRSGNWDLFVHSIGGLTTQVTSTPYDEVAPCLAGSRLAFLADELGVIDAGADGNFGTPDDFYLRQPRGVGAAENPLTAGLAAPRWCNGEFMLIQGMLVPLADDADIVSGTSVPLAIPDGDANGLESSVEVVAPSWKLVHDMRIRVAVVHPDVSELKIWLRAPSGDEVELYDGDRGGADLDVVFSLANTPLLMNHYGEPVAGSWTLRVVDDTAGKSGSLDHWEIWHRF